MMKTRSILLLLGGLLLMLSSCVEQNADVLKPNIEYYSSDYFLNDSLQVSDVIAVGSDCRLTDATDALVVDEDARYFYFLSKAFVNDDNTDAVIEVKRSDFKIRKVHINKTIAYIRNAPMNTEEIAEWEESTDIDDYKETEAESEAEFEDEEWEEW